METLYRIACPSCGARLRFSARLYGKTVACPRCRRRLVDWRATPPPVRQVEAVYQEYARPGLWQLVGGLMGRAEHGANRPAMSVCCLVSLALAVLGILVNAMGWFSGLLWRATLSPNDRLLLSAGYKLPPAGFYFLLVASWLLLFSACVVGVVGLCLPGRRKAAGVLGIALGASLTLVHVIAILALQR